MLAWYDSHAYRVGMYLRTTQRRNKDGSVVRYLALAENRRHPEKGHVEARVIHSFGREDQLDRTALERLVASIRRVLGDTNGGPDAHDAASAGSIAIEASFELGVMHVVQGLWARLGIGEAIRRAIKRSGAKSKEVAIAISGDAAITKVIQMPRNLRGADLEAQVEDVGAEDLAGLDAEGVETGMFEIPAGGRRFQALSLLVKQKRLAKTAPIPCIVRDAASDILPEDDSLAENMQRVALHPLDQFRAFQALREKGQGEEAIAAAFFVTPQIVKQRLKLASVAPALLNVYAEDGMTLEQLMAFTVNPDHARQVQVWEAVKNSWNKEPYAIRRMLTETSVRASDRRAVFVGLEAYEAAGGAVLRDLFQGDDGGWLEEPALLDRLVAESARTARLWVVSTLTRKFGTGCGARVSARRPHQPYSSPELGAAVCQ